jgi:hypothetical protein
MDVVGLMNPVPPPTWRHAGNLIWAGNSLEGNWQLRPYIAVTARPRATRKGFR